MRLAALLLVPGCALYFGEDVAPPSGTVGQAEPASPSQEGEPQLGVGRWEIVATRPDLLVGEHPFVGAVGSTLYITNEDFRPYHFATTYETVSGKFDSFIANLCTCSGAGPLVTANGRLFEFASAASRYIPATSEWTEFPYPTPYRGGSPVALGDWIYLVGQGGGTPREVHAYSVGSNDWRTVASYPFTNLSPAMATFQGKIYSFGPDATEIYDPDVDKWVDGAIMPLPTWPTGTNQMAHALGTRLLVAVQLGNSSPGLLAYDPLTNTWDTAPLALPDSLVTDVALTVAGGDLYLVGDAKGPPGRQLTVWRLR